MTQIPDWVKNALQAKLDTGDIGFAHKGYYYLTVERDECNRFECFIEMWQGRIDASELDRLYDKCIGPVWSDLSIQQL